jgi:hypothetical protein
VLKIPFRPFAAGVALLFIEGRAMSGGIGLANFNDGDTIRYPVAFLQGRLEDKTARTITVINQSSTRPTKELKGIAYKGRSKALAELVAGPNKLLLRSGSGELAVTLHYQPQTNPYHVEVIYMTDRTARNIRPSGRTICRITR